MRDLLVEAVRYGDQPEVRARLVKYGVRDVIGVKAKLGCITMTILPEGGLRSRRQFSSFSTVSPSTRRGRACSPFFRSSFTSRV